ncbi:MAG: hypothetical protein VXZ51_00150 [Actinomycetota bacterium]|nr:hypothetical protein [SAR324 cluster bacterium]MEC7737697.1 hypothetical protein [Cyanobacteriota bacterium]MEC8364353.1 hypothetical protein [Actinomycetota bacterium]
MAHRNSTAEMLDVIDISSIFSASDFLVDDADVVFENFEYASVVTGQLLQPGQSRDEYFGFSPPENGFLQWNIRDDGVITNWRNVQEGDSIQFGDDKQGNYHAAGEEEIGSDSFSNFEDIVFRFAPSAEANIATKTGFFDDNHYAELFGFEAHQPVKDELNDIALTITNSAAQSYAVGQAIGISETEANVGGDLNVFTPIEGAVSSGAAAVTTNSVALTEGTSFGGIYGSNINNSQSDNLSFNAAADLNAVANVDSSISSFANTKADLSHSLVDADAHTRVGMKLPADGGFGLLLDPTNGGFGIANIDMVGGGNVQMSADVHIGADAGAKSTEGRARSIVEVSKVTGIEDAASISGDELDIKGVSGAELNSTSYSDRGNAEATISMDESVGIIARSDDSEQLMNGTADIDAHASSRLENEDAASTPFVAGGSLSISTGSQLKASTRSVIVGDGVLDAFEIEGIDQAISVTDLGEAFGLYSDKAMGLKMSAAELMDLDIESDVDIYTSADATLGDAKSTSSIFQNNGAYNADINAGSNGSIDADASTQIMTAANTVVGDTDASGTALNTTAIGSSMFTFPGLEAEIDAASSSIGGSRAISTSGVAESSLALSTMGINGINSGEVVAKVEGAELINAVANSTGFSESAAVSGSESRDLVSANTNQAAFGLNDYSIETDNSLEINSIADIKSGATSVFGTTTI